MTLPTTLPGRARVLVVEDEALIALDLESRLVELGYEVVGIADNRDDAVDLCRRKNPNLVLMDISIRGDMDGIETARDLVEMRDVPVIFLTAYANDSTVERAAEVSPYGYLQKPFHDRTLTATIKVALARHMRDRRLGVLAHVVSSAPIGIVVVEVKAEEVAVQLRPPGLIDQRPASTAEHAKVPASEHREGILLGLREHRR